MRTYGGWEMVKPIVKDILFLGQKSVPATPLDMNVVNDLRDTLAANRERCVGMAANMIGYKKNMIIVSAGPVDMIMINPVICSKSGRYETEEGCLSLEGKRKTTRYKKIEVEFQDAGFVKRKMAFEGVVAQIIVMYIAINRVKLRMLIRTQEKNLRPFLSPAMRRIFINFYYNYDNI